MIVGVISDTHGLLRPEAVQALHGSEHIIHAGDIGAQDIIPALQEIAPVTAIRGNIDHELWTRQYQEIEVVELAGAHLYVIHNVHDLDLNPQAGGFAAIISGHSHRPSQKTKDGVLFFNPGSAGPRRFKLPISIGRLQIMDGKIASEIIELQISK